MVNCGKTAHQFHRRGACAARKVARRYGIDPGTLQRLEQILSGKSRAIGTESERGGLGAFFQALDACADRGGNAGEIEKAQGRRIGRRLRQGGPRSSCEIHSVAVLPRRLAAEHGLVRPETGPLARPVEFSVRQAVRLGKLQHQHFRVRRHRRGLDAQVSNSLAPDCARFGCRVGLVHQPPVVRSELASREHAGPDRFSRAGEHALEESGERGLELGMLAFQRGAQEASISPEHRGPQAVRLSEDCGFAMVERQGFSGEALGLFRFGMHDGIAQPLEDLHVGRMPGRMSFDLLKQRQKRAAGMRHAGKRCARKPVFTASQVGETRLRVGEEVAKDHESSLGVYSCELRMSHSTMTKA